MAPSGANHEEVAINFRQLTYFRKVVETGNITAAADMLNVAQPALGAQIRQLEQELGVELLVRHSRGVKPTAAGKLLYRRAQGILDSVGQAVQEVRALSAAKQIHLRLGVSPSMIMTLGPDLVIDSQRKFPDVTVSLLEERTPVLLDAIEQGQADIGFLYNVGERPDMVRRAFIEEDLLFVTAPTAAPQDETISFAEALRYDLAIGGERGVLRHIVEAEARRLSLELRLAYEIHSVSSMKAMVARGTAATIMPYSLAARELNEGTLTARRIVRPALTRTLYVVRARAHAPFLDDERITAHVEGILSAYLQAIEPWARRLT